MGELIFVGFLIAIVPGVVLNYAVNYCLKRGQKLGAILAGVGVAAVAFLGLLFALLGWVAGDTIAPVAVVGGITAAIIIMIVFRKPALQA